MSLNTKGVYSSVKDEETAGESDGEPAKRCTCLGVALISCCCCFCCLPIGFLIWGTPLYNSFVANEIDTYGTKVFGTQTLVQKVSLGILTGKSTVTGSSVASPEGGDFLDVAAATVDADLWTLFFSSYFHFKDLDMSSVVVNINEEADGQTNAQHIGTNVARYMKTHKATAIGQKISGYLAKRKVEVDRIKLAGIQFNVDIPMISDGNGPAGPAPFKIRNILISDVGKKTGGVNLSELLAIILQALLSALVETVPGRLRDILATKMQVGFEQLLDYGNLHVDVGQGLVQIGKSIGWVTNTISNATTNAGATVANGLLHAVNQTEENLLAPVDAMMKQAPPGIGRGPKKTLHKMIENPLKVVKTWAGAIKNASQEVSVAVNDAGGDASGTVQGVGNKVAAGDLSHLTGR